MRCDVASLTFEQYRAGAPCPGCGLPYVDTEPFDFKGTMNLSDADRVRYDAEELRFKAVHASCRSHRHGVSGSLTKRGAASSAANSIAHVVSVGLSGLVGVALTVYPAT
jgi:hypothetical protein